MVHRNRSMVLALSSRSYALLRVGVLSVPTLLFPLRLS